MSTINERISIVVGKSGLSKTAFAEKINVSQQYISKLSKEGVPSDRTIIDICREFNVSETWLRTGEGGMAVKLTRDEEIAAFMGDILKGDDFRRRLVSVLSRLEPEQWELLEKMAVALADEMKKTDP